MFSNEQVAQVCHEANRALQDIQGDPAPSQPWCCTDAEIRASAVDGVADARRGITPRDLHENWCKFKRRHGWRYGEIKDPELKTHPCLVSYDELPEEQRVKDQLFLFIVAALTVDVGRMLWAAT